jgi:uncharacterized HAD superfamily protein
MSDRLQQIWDRQADFQTNISDEIYDTDSKQKYTKEYVLQLMAELGELLREINYKAHRPSKEQLTISNIREEWIDIFKYWLVIGQVWGWAPDEFMEAFADKSAVVEQRWVQEKLLKLRDREKIIACDLDGVLADYPYSFMKFIHEETQVEPITFTDDIFRAYEKVLGRKAIRKLKHEYRETGKKRTMELCSGAWSFIKSMHSAGYSIVYLTSRPVKEYSRIFSDTLFWLRENDLWEDGRDAIIFSEKKNQDAISQFPNIEFMVEDMLHYANDISKAGKKCYLIDTDYNQGDMGKNVIRIKTLDEIR